MKFRRQMGYVSGGRRLALAVAAEMEVRRIGMRRVRRMGRIDLDKELVSWRTTF